MIDSASIHVQQEVGNFNCMKNRNARLQLSKRQHTGEFNDEKIGPEKSVGGHDNSIRIRWATATLRRSQESTASGQHDLMYVKTRQGSAREHLIKSTDS